MTKDDAVYARHILDALSKLDEYTTGVSSEAFAENRMMQDAVVRQIEIIGEASKHVSAELKKKYAAIPWKAIAGMRDKLIHDYLGVDMEAVWLTVQRDLPTLKTQIKRLVDALP